MTEPMNGSHPEPVELQAFADGEAESARVAAHVESCAVCRAEVAAIRRVTAALSLGSKPPDSLLERIPERRANSHERVVPTAPRRERRTARRFMLPLGLASAATVRVGLHHGRGDRVGVGRAGFMAMMIATAIAVRSAGRAPRGPVSQGPERTVTRLVRAAEPRMSWRGRDAIT